MTCWEKRAAAIERRREFVARTVVVIVYGVLLALTVWAICALVGTLRERADLERQAENEHYVRVFLDGGRQ